ncbi:MAG: cell division protein ZipA [Candidatus Pelagadaptatus aseana]
MREWLTVIIILLIVGVLLDGWRRVRQSRQESIKMSLSMHKETEREELMEYGSELPNGGARVVGEERGDEEARQLTQSVKDSFAQTRAPSLKNQIPEQVSLNLEEVPMLMEAVEEAFAGDVSQAREVERKEPVLDALERELGTDETITVGTGSHDSVSGDNEAPLAGDVAEAQPPAVDEAPKPVASQEEGAAQAEEVLIINVMAIPGTRFNGEALLDCLLECGMRFGEMKIFHRHVHEDGEGPVMFSMVNMVVPGTFDLNDMANFETPGISLFLSLPLGSSAMDAFNCMADTAQILAARLGGELKDENRSVMTAQTLEHCRERIREFERKKLT